MLDYFVCIHLRICYLRWNLLLCGLSWFYLVDYHNLGLIRNNHLSLYLLCIHLMIYRQFIVGSGFSIFMFRRSCNFSRHNKHSVVVGKKRKEMYSDIPLWLYLFDSMIIGVTSIVTHSHFPLVQEIWWSFSSYDWVGFHDFRFRRPAKFLIISSIKLFFIFCWYPFVNYQHFSHLIGFYDLF